MGVTMTIDTRKFEQRVLEWKAVTGQDSKKVLKEEMGLLVKRLIELTPPPHGKGGGGAAKKQGEGAVRRDVNRVFVSLKNLAEKLRSEGLRLRMRKLVDGGDLAGITAILHNFDGSTLSNASIVQTATVGYANRFRNRRGVVPRGTRQTAVMNDASILAVMKEKVAHVGRAKAGWLRAADRFGTKGVPAWVRRHGSGDGDAKETFTPTGGTLVAINRNKAIGSLDQQARIVKNAIIGRERDLAAKLKRVLDRSGKRIFRG